MNPPSLRRVNILYILIQIFYWAAFAAFVGYQTALLLERGFSSGDAGVLAAIRCLAGILAQPLLGGWADRHPQVPLKCILNVSLGLSLAVNLLLYSTCPGFWGTALIFLALGVLELNAYPLLDSMAVQFINIGMDVNYSLGRGVGSFAYAVSCAALGKQVSILGVESVLLSHMALLVLLMVTVAVYPAAPACPAAGRMEAPHSLWYILKSSRAFSRMLLAVFFAMTAVMPLVSFLVNLVTDRGGNAAHLGLGLFLMGASELPAALIFPYLRRRFGSQRMMMVAVVFMAVKPVVLLLAPSLGLLLLAQTIQMLGYGFFTPASVYYTNENVSAGDRIQGQAVMMMASNGLGGMTGNLIAGYVIDWGGVNAMLLLCAAMGAAGVMLAAASVRCGKRDVAFPR